jgi:hypothetical protein
MELIWYVCALAKTRLQRAANSISVLVTCTYERAHTFIHGTLRCSIAAIYRSRPLSLRTRGSRSGCESLSDTGLLASAFGRGELPVAALRPSKLKLARDDTFFSYTCAYSVGGGCRQCRSGVATDSIARSRAARPAPLPPHLPQLHRFVVGGEQHARVVGAAAPPDLVDLLLNLKRLEVVELRLVRLELRHVPVLEVGPARQLGSRVRAGRPLRGEDPLGAPFRTRLPPQPPTHHMRSDPFEQHDTSATVSGGEVQSIIVELYSRDDVGCTRTGASASLVNECPAPLDDRPH